jgi:hypothetical protein
MRFCACVILTVCLASLARAQQTAQTAQVDAARSDALEALRREILAAQILPDATAQTLVDRTGGAGVLSLVLTKAQQLGGPRWIDNQTCQVTLAISGDDVAKALEQLSESKPKALSSPPQVVKEKLKRWRRRTFEAVGTSIGWAAVDRLRPDPSQTNWQLVSDQDRKKAIIAAKQSAVQAVLESLKPLVLEGTHTVGEAIALPEVDEDLRKWLASRPITAVQFRDNLEVRLALSVAPQELWPQLKEALQKQKNVPTPDKTNDWIRLREQVLARMAPPVGASTAGATVATATRPVIALPELPPPWTSDALEAQATANSAGAALRTARAAETAAARELRIKIEALLLSPGLTLGEAARQDPRIAQAIDRSLQRAQIAKVDYDSPTRGSVRAELSLNLEDVWRELNAR